MSDYLAVDLGAESGRVLRGSLTDGQLELAEIHRFANRPLRESTGLQWNLPELEKNILCGLQKAISGQPDVAAVSIDSWGVDYVLIAPEGRLLSPAYHYRDHRCQRGMTDAHRLISRAEIFAETGIQFMALNTLYQLMAEPRDRLMRARHMLGIADAFSFVLCGEAKAEVSFASTTQLYDPVRACWSLRLLEKLGLPEHLFPEIVSSGTKLGTLHRRFTGNSKDRAIDVIAGCSHDTGAAVAAVPLTDGRARWAYISSGTWSLMGVELAAPIINELCREVNFTNEVGYGGTIRLLKNISGLWILQECRRHWSGQGTTLGYPDLARAAAEAPPFLALINPADPEFVAPGDMPGRIERFCAATGQPIPVGPGPMARCIFESLALLYRLTLDELTLLTGTTYERLHIVGGGSQNALLNQFTANATGLPVYAGPVEATAAGNILIQALARGEIGNLAEARRIMAASSAVKIFERREEPAWDAAYARFKKLPRDR